MSANKVISIVAQLPPQVNGVGDYAFYLADRLQLDFGLETLFIRTDKSGSTIQHKFKEELLSEKTGSALCRILEASGIERLILHYVGYAYSPRGCPFWLVEGIEAWKKIRPSAKVITVFHELYANGKIWQSAFWLHRFQKNIVFRLLKLSSGSITNSEVTYRMLRAAVPDSELLSIPVFSNIGEPQRVPEFKVREDAFIIFGSAEKRKEIFDTSLDHLLEWLYKLNVRKIIEIGPLREEKEKTLKNIEIKQLGVLTRLEISEIMIRCKYGLLQYPLALLSKSGIFAAYSAHGIVPVVLGKHPMNYESNGLKSGIHYLNDVTLAEDHEKISEHILKWYQGHTIPYISSQVFNMIRKA